MSRIYVRGAGAVSPAGWGLPALRSALAQSSPLPTETLPAPGGDRSFAVRRVPPLQGRPSWLTHPRFRRASRISHFAVASALEALGAAGVEPGTSSEGSRLGIVAATHAGSLRYSEQFFGEVLRDPPTASPILFPETVINAPASHVAAYLNHDGPCLAVIADQTAFVQAVLLAARWLHEDQVDRCLVLGLDEVAWTLADAVGHLAPGTIPSEGAGALVLARGPSPGPGMSVELRAVTDARRYSASEDRRACARAMRRQLPGSSDDAGLVDSRCGHARADAPETEAWKDWIGPRCSPREILGEALSAATAWQFVQAWADVAEGLRSSAVISVVGASLQAVGASLARSSPMSPSSEPSPAA